MAVAIQSEIFNLTYKRKESDVFLERFDL